MRDNDSLILEGLYSGILLNENSDEEYMRLAENPEENKEELQRIVDAAAKDAVKKNPRLLYSFGQILTKEEFDEASSKITKLPRGVFYVGDIEVIRNPTDSDRRRLTSEVRSEFGRDVSGDPATRFTNDTFGNTWVWKAHQGIHSQMEPLIQRKENASLDQNNQKVERSGIVRNAVRSGAYIPEATRKEFESRYGEFYKESSSNPVEYDDEGNIIPLSQRFDSSNDDIRY